MRVDEGRQGQTSSRDKSARQEPYCSGEKGVEPALPRRISLMARKVVQKKGGDLILDGGKNNSGETFGPEPVTSNCNPIRMAKMCYC